MFDKCAAQFTGRWSNENLIEYDDKTDPEDFLSYHTLSAITNYAYEGDIDWTSMQVAVDDDKVKKDLRLDMLLDLHQGADYWMIPALASQVEGKILDAGREFINLKNVIAVRRRAELSGANVVEQFCSLFIQYNWDAVDKLHSVGNAQSADQVHSEVKLEGGE